MGCLCSRLSGVCGVNSDFGKIGMENVNSNLATAICTVVVLVLAH
ncbi:hypothetical protein V6615_04870 [Oscillospiraceae bacterium PP1C4]